MRKAKNAFARFHAARPTYAGIEEVLLVTHKHIGKFKPSVVVVDPITNLLTIIPGKNGKVAAGVRAR